ncbi:diaminopimelate epimerase [Fibrella sp. WM1]|uniref:diaminopimelate epimerase n=1 Tax=Fibrella musci TaxID=3242485 RepID=UPI00351FD259
MTFYKYQGTGNDFVLIDDRAQTFPAHDQALIAHLCHRRFGIGADGLILLQNHPDYDFRMVYFNADGAEGSMCGNGGRCIVRFAHDLRLFDSTTRFLAVDGEHTAEVRGELVHLHMSDVADMAVQPDHTFLNTGSPHVVQFVDDVDEYDVVAEGRAIRYSAAFAPGGTNVNFTQLTDDGRSLSVRTYERGVEDETYSCGTGVTAAALAAYRHHGLPSPVAIQVVGGALQVSFSPQPDGRFSDIYLIGPAKRVFTGELTV